MDDYDPADKDFLGCRVGTNCARINALLPGPNERPIRKIELAKRAEIPAPQAPSSAHVSHLESFVKGHRECRLRREEPGLIRRAGVEGRPCFQEFCFQRSRKDLEHSTCIEIKGTIAPSHVPGPHYHLSSAGSLRVRVGPPWY